MGWENRGGRRYFYRKVRRGRKVASLYIEAGRLGEEWTSVNRKVVDLLLKHADADESSFADYFVLVQKLAHAALQAAGYHRHDRGCWRKRRMGEVARSADVQPAEISIADQRARDVVKRARAGDRSALPELRELFDREPARYMAIGFGDVAQLARDREIRRVAKEDLVSIEAMRRKLDEMEAELAGPSPSPIEKLLAERAALCWFQVNSLDVFRPGDDAPGIERHESRRDRAHRRYLSALKTLATIRKLRLPAIQINLGEQQVNVAGDLVRPQPEPHRPSGDILTIPDHS